MHASPAALLAVLLAVPLVAPASAAPVPASDGADQVTRIVTLDNAPSVTGRSADARRAGTAAVSDAQREVIEAAGRAGVDLTVTRRYRYALNGFAVRLPASQEARLAALPGVASVSVPVRYDAPEPPTPVSEDQARTMLAAAAKSAKGAGGTSSGRESVTATTLTGVPEVHRAGLTGRGVTLGIIDSGVAYDHPALGAGTFPNAKVIGGYDFADGDADPYDDAAGSAAGHGTHVAGIIAGDDDRVRGVAPDARLRSYRVFGNSGQGAGEEVILAAIDRAAEDGVDVVNMSLGSAIGSRSTDVLARAADRLVSSGTTVTIAVGNGYAGPFRASSPAVADQAIAVGSTFNTGLPHLALTVDGDAAPIAFEVSGRGPVTPASGGAPYAVMPGSCAALPEGSLRGRIAVFPSAPFSGSGEVCRPMDLARTAEAAGAVAAVLHDPGIPADAIPGGPCCGATGIPFVSVAERDALRILATPEGTHLDWGSYTAIKAPGDQAGLMDYGSAWGPGNELEFKPDLAAPGGYIFSTLPKALGWYGVSSGTSMASPHAAGVAALLLQKNPGLTPLQVRTALQNTATPLAMTGDPDRGDQPVAQQGAGRIDAVAAVAAVSRGGVTASPSELPLGDLEGRPVTRRITLHNDSDHVLSYTVKHRTAVSAMPPYTAEWKASDAQAGGHVLGLDRVTVRPHSSARVQILVTQPRGVPEGTLFGGWFEFTATGADHSVLRVPYQGLAGDYDAVSAVNPTFSAINTKSDNPSLRPDTASVGKNLPLTVDLTDGSTANDSAAVMLSHGFPLLERLRLQVLDPSGHVVATPYDDSWITRNSGAGTGIQFYSWDLRLGDGTAAPAGVYRLRLVFDKALGDRDHAPGTEFWTSPEVTLVR
ncbi:S8 family serine peptidase [Streptomyces sp. NPDC059446]|uniref:S8 family serine peptidase n=1 Tax=Streptomyces sp. NPDC059446 TaxID=3346833 RepID=UPI0036A3F02A